MTTTQKQQKGATEQQTVRYNNHYYNTFVQVERDEK